eukprot:TRINITY_DN4004_c0_g1_i1.p1 TRINITY_DN4004_c0_g1~~TRINITY_DN4004_c0_g1_i1.p1  ORF type:complete len:119 (-),score=24.20 TRINITY_DN4004_c0_g1_i1:66-422(-)
MNQPEAEEFFNLQEGQQKLVYNPDTKLSNAGIYTIKKEDHTLGNLLRMQLLEDPDVLFAGYRVPHPLHHDILVRIQTNKNSNPHIAMNKAVQSLKHEFMSIEEQFQNQLERQDNDRML